MSKTLSNPERDKFCNSILQKLVQNIYEPKQKYLSNYRLVSLLITLKYHKAIPFFIKFLENPGGHVRIKGIILTGLGGFGDKRYMPIIRTYAENKNHIVSRAAIHACTMLQDYKCLPIIKKELENLRNLNKNGSNAEVLEVYIKRLSK